MKIFYTLLLISLLSLTNIVAQNSITNPEKEGLSDYEAASLFSPDKIDKLVFSTSVVPYWFKHSNKFWYIYRDTKERHYYMVDPVKGQKREIFNNAQLAAQLTEIVGDPYDASNIPIGRIRLQGDSVFIFEVTSSIVNAIEPKTGEFIRGVKIYGFEYNISTSSLRKIEDYKSPNFYPYWGSISPNRKFVVYSKNFNLYYITWEDFKKIRLNYSDTTAKEIQITFDGTALSPYGKELGSYSDVESDSINKRSSEIIWTEDSKHFVIKRKDLSNVKDLWVVNSLSKPRPTLFKYKYHMAGEKEAPQESIYVFDTDSFSSKKIEIERFKDQSLTLHSKPHSAKSKFDDYKFDILEGNKDEFYVTRVSRDHKRLDLCKVTIATGEVTPIIEERFNSYIESRPPAFIDNKIFWWSQRDGWGHLYKYSTDGTFINRVTSGDFHVEKIVSIDTIGQTLFISANGVDKSVNPYYTQQCRVSFQGSEFKVLTPVEFDNETYASDNGEFFITNYSRVNSAPKSALLDAKGNLILNLEESDFSQLFNMGYKFPEPFSTKAADGKTDLYGVIYKPFNFDSTKSYPIIEYVYPGPHTEAVNYSWSSDMDQRDRLAQLGFIVVTVGNRGGHPFRSKWYHNYGYGNLRDYGIADKKAVIENLAAKYSFIDSKRVGIFGHSGGGFMTASALLLYPDFFKVGVSLSGNHDNTIYNRWWGEKYHGVKEVIKESGDTVFSFNIQTTIELAPNLKGRLMLVTGDIDNNVHPANTFRLAEALIKANKRFDMFVLPGQRHIYSSMKEYLFWLTADYFTKHLLSDS